MADAPDFGKFVFPIVRRMFGGGEPLRRNIDYQSSARKTYLVMDDPIPCTACKRISVQAGADEGCPECTVRLVLES